MKRFFASLIVWASSLTASAQDLPNISEPCAPEVVENRRAIVIHGGDGGIWFHMDVARCMLGRLAALPAYAEHVRLLETRLTLSDDRSALQAREVALATQEAETATEALTEASRGRREAMEQLVKERRWRSLWAALGVALTVALGSLSIWGYSKLSL